MRKTPVTKTSAAKTSAAKTSAAKTSVTKRRSGRTSAALDQAIAHACETLEDLEAEVGPITARKMFGGAGLYAGGKIFAVLVDGALFLKGDAALGAAFEAAGGTRWRYEGKKAPVAMPYWSPPPDAVDDRDALAGWARRSIAVAHGA